MNNSKFKNQKSKLWNRGFTVLESIVAIMVISLSIAGAFSAVTQSLRQGVMAKNQVQAFYLAQEAMEAVRNLRDSNQIRVLETGAGNWLDNIVSACPFSMAGNPHTCTIDATNLQISNCGGTGQWGSCSNLRQDSSSYLYGYNGSWTLSGFKREMQIEQVSTDEIAVTVQVSWTEGTVSKSFKVKAFMFNWSTI